MTPRPGGARIALVSLAAGDLDALADDLGQAGFEPEAHLPRTRTVAGLAAAPLLGATALWHAALRAPNSLSALGSAPRIAARAAALARRMTAAGIAHVHAATPGEDCEIALLAARLTGASYSFRVAEPAPFRNVTPWRIEAKLERAAFVLAADAHCRSQCLIYLPIPEWEKVALDAPGAAARMLRRPKSPA